MTPIATALGWFLPVEFRQIYKENWLAELEYIGPGPAKIALYFLEMIKTVVRVRFAKLKFFPDAIWLLVLSFSVLLVGSQLAPVYFVLYELAGLLLILAFIPSSNKRVVASFASLTISKVFLFIVYLMPHVLPPRVYLAQSDTLRLLWLFQLVTLALGITGVIYSCLCSWRKNISLAISAAAYFSYAIARWGVLVSGTGNVASQDQFSRFFFHATSHLEYRSALYLPYVLVSCLVLALFEHVMRSKRVIVI